MDRLINNNLSLCLFLCKEPKGHKESKNTFVIAFGSFSNQELSTVLLN